MSCFLPPEIFDLITEYLCNCPTALKACCLVSKSWVPRTKKHLFARIHFGEGGSTIQSWVKAFPDPSNSPGHHTRDLGIYGPPPGESTWIRSFHRIEKLSVFAFDSRTSETSLVQLHGLSPTLKSLYLIHFSIPTSEIFGLLCSFPLLVNFGLYHRGFESDDSDLWVAPSTSPKFTGALHLFEVIRSTALLLLALPDGLHFTKIMVKCYAEDVGLLMSLVSKCSDTLESLCIDYCTPRAFHSAPDVCNILPLARSLAWSTASTRPVPRRKTKRRGVSICKAKCSMDHRNAPDRQNKKPSAGYCLLIHPP